VVIEHLPHMAAAAAAMRCTGVLIALKAPSLFGRVTAKGAQVTTAPGEVSVHQWLAPGRGIFVEASVITGLVTVLAAQDASEGDWQAARDVLSTLHTAPLGEPEFLDEFNAWTTVTCHAEALAAA
jgi:hypothetical protein